MIRTTKTGWLPRWNAFHLC